jgi:hypothetical protein
MYCSYFIAIADIYDCNTIYHTFSYRYDFAFLIDLFLSVCFILNLCVRYNERKAAYINKSKFGAAINNNVFANHTIMFIGQINIEEDIVSVNLTNIQKSFSAMFLYDQFSCTEYLFYLLQYLKADWYFTAVTIFRLFY